MFAARLELNRYDGDAAASMTVSIQPVTRSWAEGTGYDLQPGPQYSPDGATWLLAAPGQSWSVPGGDADRSSDFGHGASGIVDQIALPAGAKSGWLSCDATGVVGQWVAGERANHGLLLQGRDAENTNYFLASRNHETAAWQPKLVVDYAIELPPTPTSETPLPPADMVLYLPILLQVGDDWPVPLPHVHRLARWGPENRTADAELRGCHGPSRHSRARP